MVGYSSICDQGKRGGGGEYLEKFILNLIANDAEAELGLRGRQPPESQVAAETAAIIEGLGRTLEAMPAGITRSMVAEAMRQAAV